jgi:hypothetical protein
MQLVTQSIAFATNKNCSKDAFSLRKVAGGASISVTAGLHQGDGLVTSGIENFLRHQGGEWNVSWLSVSRSAGVPDAFPLQSDLTGSKREPSLISLMRELDKKNFPEEEAWFFSATEWLDTDEVLILDGSVSELLGYLSTVRTTGIWLWSPETLRVQDSDRYPFAFRLIPQSR